MFFNEENMTNATVEDDTHIQSVDMDLEAAGDIDNIEEDVDLDYDDLKANGFKAHENPYSSVSGVDLDYDALDNQTTQEDTIHESEDLDMDDLSEGCGNSDLDSECGGGDIRSSFGDMPDTNYNDMVHEDIDLDYEDALDNQTNQEDTIHESAAIAFSEDNVRVYQRRDYNLITESDLSAVMNYYNNKINESEAINLIANAHHLNEYDIKVLVESKANLSRVADRVYS
jgi:hypothetical protein